jgi:hypothetical protein
VNGCIDEHAGHPGDCVDVDGTGCDAPACLPSGAPGDASLPCCDGLSCTDGVCPKHLSHITMVSAGTAFALAPEPDGTVLAWGDNTSRCLTADSARGAVSTASTSCRLSSCAHCSSRS